MLSAKSSAENIVTPKSTISRLIAPDKLHTSREGPQKLRFRSSDI